MTEEGQNLKIGICIPWDSPFMFTAPAFNMMNWERPENTDVVYFMGSGWCPAARHNDAVEKALQWGADLIMFNGGDHLCPFDILKKMLARIHEGWDMVHVMPPSRGVVGYDGTPFKTISYKVVGPLPQHDAILHAPAGSTEIVTWDDEPQQTHISGTGNIMMRASIFDGLQRPFFEEVIKKDNKYGRWCVQDSQFVYRCTIEGNAKMFCDTSIHIIHLDIFGIDETYSERFKDKTNQRDWSPAKDLRKYVWPGA